MADIHQGHSALGDVAARTLANATKTVPQLSAHHATLVCSHAAVGSGRGRYLPGQQGKEPARRRRRLLQREEEREFDTTFVDYEEWGREYYLSAVNTVVDIHTRVSDLYSSPHNQIHEQVRLAIEMVKERQERELLNNAEYGLLKKSRRSMKISARTGAPTPDDMDELIASVWKEPAFFLAHPQRSPRSGGSALAGAFRRRRCPVRLAVPHLARRSHHPLATGPVATARQHPAVRVGESRQGVVGLYQPGLTGEQGPGLSVRFMGINHKATRRI